MSVEANLRDTTDGTSKRAEQDHITAAVGRIIENRAVIDQAKGMLMFVYGIHAEAAFELLRWQSQDHNVKIRNLAEQIVKDLAEVHESTPLARRISYDRIILTAHARIVASPPMTCGDAV